MIKIQITAKNEAELSAKMLEHSRNNAGAWIASVMPFGGPVYLLGFASASSIPDSHLSHTPNVERGIAVAGKFRPYSKAALVREQNRGYNADR